MRARAGLQVLALCVVVVATGCSGSTATHRSTATSATAASAGCRGSSAASSGRGNLVVGGRTRTYRLDTPDAARARGPRPLILLFHGSDGSAESMASYSGLPAYASRAGYVVATPDGTNATWQLDASGSDAAFVDKLVRHVFATACIDEKRVYASGFSAGAAFTILYSCRHQGEIAAIATVAVEFQLGCSAPMPIVAFHGTKDPAVPFDDGAVGLSLPGVHVRGTELNMEDWARLDTCRTSPTTTPLGSEVTHQVWPGCAAGTAVELYRIEGGGHTWPGADATKGEAGLTTEQVQADQVIVDFFDQHPAPRA
jgi:polyhydroxybutyrate depolymerase